VTVRCLLLCETWIAAEGSFSIYMTVYWEFIVVCSIFENGPIPYPKREFLTDDDNDDKMDTATSKVTDTVVFTFS